MSSANYDLPSRPPAFVDEAQTLLRTEFFDDERQDHLQNNFAALEGEELGARRLAYTATLGVLALERSEGMITALLDDPGLNKAQWAKNWQATPSRLRELADRESEKLEPVARRLAILKHAERSLRDGYAQQGLYDHQVPYLQGIVSGMQRGPQQVILPDWWKGGGDYRLMGQTVHGPTGIGKTAIMARAAMAFGVGKPPEIGYKGEKEPDPVRVVAVVPSQGLIAQMKGEIGSDTFRRFAPGITVGGYYSLEKSLDSSIIFSTIPMFVRRFRDGKFAGKLVDGIFIDETHHLTERLFLETLLRHWDGLTIGFTATPAYNFDKDVRNILRHEVKSKSILEYSNVGVLSKLRIYSLIIHPKDFEASDEVNALSFEDRKLLRQEALALTARDTVKPLVEQGRRGMLFCEPGSNSAHAQRVAELLSEVELESGRKIVAEAMGSFQGTSNSPENSDVLKRFNEGKVDVVTTVLMGQEALDADEVNFVGEIGETTSVLRLYQMAGRGARPSEAFETTVLFSITPVNFGNGRFYTYTKTFADILSDGVVDQGVVVANNLRVEQSKVKDGPIVFPEHIQNLLDRIQGKTIAEAIIGFSEQVEVPPDYVFFDKIIEGTEIAPSPAHAQLLRAGYEFIGRSEFINQRFVFRRYYEPAAATYFTDDPTPPKNGLQLAELRGFSKSSDVVTAEDMAELLGLNKKVLMRDFVTKEEKAQSKMRRIDGSGGRARAWSQAEGMAIAQRIKDSMTCPAHLIPMAAALSRLNTSYNAVVEHVRINRDKYSVVRDFLEEKERATPGLPWNSLRMLERKYGINDKFGRIAYEKLPQPGEDDPEKIAYARKIQKMLGVQKKYLPFEQNGKFKEGKQAKKEK